MRQVFANPQPFINQAITTAVQENFTGYNVDWEPTSNATAEDAINYAKFLSTFAASLHAIGKNLSVDVATWSNVWNYTLLSASGVDKVMTMSTYTNDTTTWKKQFDYAISTIALDHLGIGLEDDLELSLDDLEYRFQEIVSYSVKEVDIWKMPIPDFWWPSLYKYTSNNM